MKEIFLITCLTVFALIFLCFIVQILFIYPITRYYMRRKSNRIQWKAVKAPDFEGRYDLYYRVYQSSLPKLVKLLYSEHHDWKCITESKYKRFKDKFEFIEFAKSHPTFGDIDGSSTVEDNAWIYPPEEYEK